MANEILHSTLETDLRMASILERELRVLLTDTASIRNVPGALLFAGDVNGLGSDTKLLRYAALDGYDEFASATEIEDVAQTQLTDASVSLAVGRYALKRIISDLAHLTGVPGGDIDPFSLAADMAMSAEGCFMQLVANAVDDASTNVGSSGVNMSTDDFFDAIFQLELSDVPGPYFALLHARQLADLQEDIRAEGGPVQYVSATADMLKIKGQGYAGNWLGVDIFRSSNINSAGGNREGAMWGAGAVAYAIGTPRPLVGAGGSVRPAGTPIVVEFERDASSAYTEVVGHMYAACAIAEQARIVGIVTDA